MAWNSPASPQPVVQLIAALARTNLDDCHRCFASHEQLRTIFSIVVCISQEMLAESLARTMVLHHRDSPVAAASSIAASRLPASALPATGDVECCAVGQPMFE